MHVRSCGNARRYLLFVAESFLGKHNPRAQVALEVLLLQNLTEKYSRAHTL